MDLDLFEEIRDRVGASTMSKPALVGLVALLVVVAVIAAGRLIGTATATEFEVEPASGEAAAPVQAGAADDGPSTLFVHVSGEVVRPGLCEVPEGSRVADAVQAAGGFTEDAAADSVNLARLLSDGEQIVIARVGAAQPVSEGIGEAESQATAGGAGAGLVNINTATSSELQQLPGVGPSTAEKIVSDRKANGSFTSKEDLKRVSGIGDKKYEALADLICI